MTYGTSHHAAKRSWILKKVNFFTCSRQQVGGLMQQLNLVKLWRAQKLLPLSSEEKWQNMEYGADEVLLYPSGKMDRDQQKKLSDDIKELTNGTRCRCGL